MPIHTGMLGDAGAFNTPRASCKVRPPKMSELLGVGSQHAQMTSLNSCITFTALSRPAHEKSGASAKLTVPAPWAPTLSA